MYSDTDIEFFMRRALEIGEAAGKRDEVPVGAVLVCDGKILAEGANRREEKHRAVSHAEIESLENYGERTNQWRVPAGTSLIVTVEPCLMCVGALIWARVDSLYYGCPDPKNAGLNRVRPYIEAGVFDHRFKEMRGGFLEDQCRDLISGYFKEKRRMKSHSNRASSSAAE